MNWLYDVYGRDRQSGSRDTPHCWPGDPCPLALRAGVVLLICTALASPLRAQAGAFPHAILHIDPAAPAGAKGYVVIVKAAGAAPIRVLANRFSAVKPVVSPDGTHFAFDDYALAGDDTRPECTVWKCRRTKLVVADFFGHIVLSVSQVMAENWGSFCESFDVVEWIDAGRIGVGCYGGTNYTYSTIIVPSGKVGVSYVSWIETTFTWSPDKQHVAYIASRPHWPPNGMRSDQPAIDDEMVGERDKTPEIAVHGLSGLAWSPDGQRIVWIDNEESCSPGNYSSSSAGDNCGLHESGRYLATAGLRSGYRSMALPTICASKDQASAPNWIDATHLKLRCISGSPISVSDTRFKSHLQPAPSMKAKPP